MDNFQKIYVIEHMEPFLFAWSMHEYIQILKYLKRSFFISKYGIVEDFQSQKIVEMEQNKANKEELTKFKDIKYLEKPIHEYLVNDKFESRVCLLDMRAQLPLTPEDAGKFDVFIFGGILGDHPPRDRTQPLRKDNIEMRGLGNLQLSTDTAVLVTKLIIENQMRFEEIRFLDEPEIIGRTEDGIESCVQMEGFRYVTKEYDIESEKFKKDEELSKLALMSDFVKEKILDDDVNLDDIVSGG